jgi:hypothetical protein
MLIYIILLTGGTVAFAVECQFYTSLILSNLPPALQIHPASNGVASG